MCEINIDDPFVFGFENFVCKTKSNPKPKRDQVSGGNVESSLKHLHELRKQLKSRAVLWLREREGRS